MKTDKNFLTGALAGVSVSLLIVTAVLAGALLCPKTAKGLLPFLAKTGEVSEPPSPAVTAANAETLPAEKTQAEAPARGGAETRITLTEFADFRCPFCKQAHETLRKILEAYPGQIKSVFKHYPLARTPGEGSFLIHEASVCAQEQGKFWEFHDAVFELSDTPDRAKLVELAQKIGLEAAALEACLASVRPAVRIEADREEGSQKGVQGTPTIFITAEHRISGAYPYEHFKRILDAFLDPENKPTRVLPERAEPQIFEDLAGKPFKGPENAPVTLVEFSDFHCPFCKRVGPTLEELLRKYPDKVRRVWRHFPLPMHEGAARSHEASLCAGEEGKFWEYHDKLFQSQAELNQEGVHARIAAEIGLDPGAFDKCLAEGRYRSAVEEDRARGEKAGVSGTPAVFVNGRLVSGAQPYENFERLVLEELKKG